VGRLVSLLAGVGVAFAAATSLGASSAGSTAIKLDRGAFPDYPLSAFGSVWVESHRGLSLYRINPKSNKVRRFMLPESQCGPLAAGAGRLWFSNCFGEAGVARVYAVDPRSGRVVARRPGTGVAFAGGSVWVVDKARNDLIRTDPATGVVLARLKLGIHPAPNGTWAGSSCAGSLWTANGSDGVQRTNLQTNATRVIALPGGYDPPGPGYFAVNLVGCADGKVWVPDGAGLYEVDPLHNTAKLLPMKIGPFSQQGDVSLVDVGSNLYLRTSDTSVARIDARTGKIDARYRAAGGGGGVAVADGSLWVVNALPATVWREQL
jgi:streptogramin lyase